MDYKEYRDTTLPVVHVLKTWPVHFQEIKNGTKTFELRKNDRNFAMNDFLFLEEYNPDTGKYTGNRIICRVGTMVHGLFGLKDDYCAMSLLKVTDISD